MEGERRGTLTNSYNFKGLVAWELATDADMLEAMSRSNHAASCT